MNKTVYFRKSALEVIEKYMQEHNCSFNTAVINLILAYKKTNAIKMLINIQNKLNEISNKLGGIHE